MTMSSSVSFFEHFFYAAEFFLLWWSVGLLPTFFLAGVGLTVGRTLFPTSLSLGPVLRVH